MDISPNDLRTYEFQTQMRGYDREEVRNLLEKGATALEKAKQDYLRLSMEMDSLKSQLAGLRQFEDSIKNAAIDARRNADLTIANAKREAEIMLTKARAEAEQVVGSRADKAEELEKKIAALENAYKNYLSKLRTTISAHMDMVNESSTFNLDGTRSSDGSPLQVTDSADITTKGRTTFASEPTQSGPIRREEANAPDKFIVTPAQEMKAPTQPTQTTQGSTVDPDLAASLEQYSNRSGKISTTPGTPTSKVQTQQFTTVHEPPTTPAPDASGRLHISSNFSSAQSFEHSVINIDTPVSGSTTPPAPATNVSNSADNLAEELDKVVAKFEEEMSKAEKN